MNMPPAGHDRRPTRAFSATCRPCKAVTTDLISDGRGVSIFRPCWKCKRRLTLVRRKDLDGPPFRVGITQDGPYCAEVFDVRTAKQYGQFLERETAEEVADALNDQLCGRPGSTVARLTLERDLARAERDKLEASIAQEYGTTMKVLADAEKGADRARAEINRLTGLLKGSRSLEARTPVDNARKA